MIAVVNDQVIDYCHLLKDILSEIDVKLKLNQEFVDNYLNSTGKVSSEDFSIALHYAKTFA
jgi:hypothetical protein